MSSKYKFDNIMPHKNTYSLDTSFESLNSLGYIKSDKNYKISKKKINLNNKLNLLKCINWLNTFNKLKDFGDEINFVKDSIAEIKEYFEIFNIYLDKLILLENPENIENIENIENMENMENEEYERQKIKEIINRIKDDEIKYENFEEKKNNYIKNLKNCLISIEESLLIVDFERLKLLIKIIDNILFVYEHLDSFTFLDEITKVCEITKEEIKNIESEYKNRNNLNTVTNKK